MVLGRTAVERQRASASEAIEALEADHSLEEPLFFDGGHPTSEGYALFAEEVAAFGVEAGLVA